MGSEGLLKVMKGRGMGPPLKEVGLCSGPSDSPVLSRDAVITQGEGLDLRTDGDPLQVKLRHSPCLISEEDMRLALELRTPDASEALSPGATNDALMEEAARFPGQNSTFSSFGGRGIFSIFFALRC